MREARPLESNPDVILQRAADGDGRAWEVLVRRYTPRIYGLILKHCRDPELAEEMTQATFVKLVPKLSQFAGYEERGRFDPYVFRIAMNLLRDEMRRRSRQAVAMDMSGAATSGSTDSSPWAAVEQRIVMGGPNPAVDPAEATSRAEQVEILRQAMNELGEADRQVLHLRHTAGLSFAQIAETIDQPLGTVLARAHRAVKKLKKMLNADDNVASVAKPSARK